jgi:hypothetical protein
MLLRETIAAYSDNYIKHTNTFFGQNAELLPIEITDYSYPDYGCLPCDHPYTKLHSVRSEKTWCAYSPLWELQISQITDSFAPCVTSLPPACLLVSWWTVSWTLKMEAICSSETSVGTQRITRRYIPEDGTIHNHRCENLKSYNLEILIKKRDSCN